MAKKTYLYKVFRNNQYIGLLPQPANELTYVYNINTPGTAIELEIPAKFENVGATVVEEMLVTQTGEAIVDENSINIDVSQTYSFNNIPIDLGNEVQVWMYSERYPSGLKVFAGLISRWTSSHINDNLRITVLSWGVQLSNYMLSSDPSGQAIDQESYNNELTMSLNSKDTFANRVSQSFTIAAPTTIGSFKIACRASSSSTTNQLVWQLYNGTPSSPGSLIDTGTVTLSDTVINLQTFQLTASLTLAAGNYFISMYNPNFPTSDYGTPLVEYSTASSYAGGGMFTSTDQGATWTAVTNGDLAFVISSATGSTSLTFVNNDPGTIVLRIMAQLVSQGSKITYTTSTIRTTSTSVNYSYGVATVLEGIQKALALSPAGFYWYIDPASNIFYFLQMIQTATHKMSLGKHINELELTYTLENVRNVVVFSGGDSGGSNIYTLNTSTASKASNGQWLQKLSDSRVTTVADADILTSNFLGQNYLPTFQTKIVVPDSVYDIETFDIGETVGFQNFNSLIDSLVLQIVGKEYHPNYIVLSLGSVPPIATSEYDQLRNRLDALDTMNNPSTPS